MDIRPLSYGAEPPSSLFKRVEKLVPTQNVRIGPKFGEQTSFRRKRKKAEKPQPPSERTSLDDEGSSVLLLWA